MTSDGYLYPKLSHVAQLPCDVRPMNSDCQIKSNEHFT